MARQATPNPSPILKFFTKKGTQDSSNCGKEIRNDASDAQEDTAGVWHDADESGSDNTVERSSHLLSDKRRTQNVSTLAERNSVQTWMRKEV